VIYYKKLDIMKLSIRRSSHAEKEPPHSPDEGKKEHVKKMKKETVKPVEGNAKPKEAKSQPTVIRSNPAEFAAMVAREIVKNFSSLRVRPRDIHIDEIKDIPAPEGENLILVDTSVLIDGRILPIVNSGFLAGTLLVPEFVLGEVQHIADSSDSLRRAKGRRGLEVVSKMMSQKANDVVVTKVIKDDAPTVSEVDHKLIALAKQWKTKLLTVDFNLAQLARVEGVKVLNVHDLGQAIKLSIIPGEELAIKITHEGKEREQGVGYLPDGTMVVVENAKEKVGVDIVVVISKVHQTSAGQLFFARLK
jgi:uncharacterized protein YacL